MSPPAVTRTVGWAGSTVTVTIVPRATAALRARAQALAIASTAARTVTRSMRRIVRGMAIAPTRAATASVVRISMSVNAARAGRGRRRVAREREARAGLDWFRSLATPVK